MTNLSYENQEERYQDFEKGIQQNLMAALQGDKRLFTTNTEELFDLHLSNLPKDKQEHYNCRACRKFINSFGGLVTIDASGRKESAVYDRNNTPPFFEKSVEALLSAIESSKVNGVFVANEKTLGQPMTGQWSHLSLSLPNSFVNSSRLNTAGQVMAEKRQDFEMLMNATRMYSLEVVEQAIALLNSETMYRGDRLLGNAKWFKDVVSAKGYLNAEQFRNIAWNAVATAPVGFTHIRSSMIGTLLDDISEGLSARVVAARFAEKMNPNNFMRSTAAPTANALMEAEKTVAKLGLENSLDRRYADFEEVSLAWSPRKKKETQGKEIKTAGMFAHLSPLTKNSTESALPNLDIPAKLMTWEKFESTVLPNADKIEILTNNANRFMALVTAADAESENILQWNNPFSWYYHGGADGEMKRRVENAGGKYENNEIRATLMWGNKTDLDVHCVTPNGTHIYYGNKHSRDGGYLDVDMNVHGETDKPVENIRWASNAPQGKYQFYVHNYTDRSRYNGYDTPFKVELEVDGTIYTFEGVSAHEGSRETVFEFDYRNGKVENMRTQATQTGNSEAWGVEMNQFLEVKGITHSPNLWNEEKFESAGKHIFFLIDGVRDTTEGKGRGFFNEMLKPELREIRKVLELYTANTPILGAEQANACGIGYSKDREWDATLRITEGSSTRNVKIDRWD